MVELDGYAFHKEGTKQNKRDKVKDKILKEEGLKLKRFQTAGSYEKTQLMEMLKEAMQVDQ